MQTEYIGTVQQGRLSCGPQVAKALQRWEGKRVSLKLSEAKKRRSISQNAYYWGVVVPAVQGLLEQHGNTYEPEEIHEFLKARVGGLRKVVIAPGGPEIVTQSTARLSTTEFQEYLAKVVAWAAEFDLQIPEPNENPITQPRSL